VKKDESIGNEASELSTRHITKSCWIVEEDNGMEERDSKSSVTRNALAFIITVNAIFGFCFSYEVLSLLEEFHMYVLGFI
jgi:hypothetical protein